MSSCRAAAAAGGAPRELTRRARPARRGSRNGRRRRGSAHVAPRDARALGMGNTLQTCPMFDARNGPMMELLQEPRRAPPRPPAAPTTRIACACVPPAARRAIRMPAGTARRCARRAGRCQPRLTLRAWWYAGTDFGARLQIHVSPLPSSGDASRRRRRAERPDGRALWGGGRVASRAARVAGAAPGPFAARTSGRAPARQCRADST
jgi:hypothetical protein